MRTPQLSKVSSALIAIILSAACQQDPAGPSVNDAGLVFARAAAGTHYSYAVSGDVRSADGSVNATARASGSPFKNMSLSNVVLTVGSPTGSGCDSRFTYASSFGANEGLSYTGSLSQASQTRTLNFLGTRVGGSEVFQLSVSGANAVETKNADGSYTLAYRNAAAYSDSRSTYFDGLYRCVNVTVTATP